jgi:hypothetical protein
LYHRFPDRPPYFSPSPTFKKVEFRTDIAARRFAILRIAETAPKAELSAATRRKVGI